MNAETWCRRLTQQLPGWKVWRQGIPGEGWCAVPAPPGTDIGDALKLPHRLGPYRTPQELREAADGRYGWGDHCETCGAPWQECGHRAPETKVRA